MNILVKRTGKEYSPQGIQLLIDRIKSDKFRNVCFSLDSELIDVLEEFKTIIDFNPDLVLSEAQKHAKMAYDGPWGGPGLLTNIEV